jgi:predicted RNA-binding protein with RPS1 domain
MDHRDAFESTAEPVARPASPEAGPHEAPAPLGSTHAWAPSDALPDVAQADTSPSEPAAAEAPAGQPALVQEEPEQREPVTEAVVAEPTLSEVESDRPSASESESAEPVAAESRPVADVAAAFQPETSAAVSSEPVSSELPAAQVAEPEPAAPATVATVPAAIEAGSEAVAPESVAGESAPGEPAAPAPVDPRRLRAQQSWERVVAAHTSGEHMTGTVTAAVKGGLLVDVAGIRGFLPASQVRVPLGTALETLVKTKVLLKVLDIDNTRRRIVVSQRRAVDEDRRLKRADLLRSLAVGQTREATVARLTDFGAFVDLGGIDGLIPMRELAFERIEKASDVVNVGEQVTVQVLRIEENGKKIALSRKNALPDPWRDHAAVLRNGTTTEGKVVAKEPQLIVEIAPGVTGAVRADEVNPADYELGEAIEVTVRSVDRVRRRIVLSTLQAATAAAAPQMQQMTSSGFAPLGVELSQRKR